MKKVKYLSGVLALSAAMLLGSTSLKAQTPPPPPAPAGAQAPQRGQHQQMTPDQRADRRIKMMKKNLGISDDQATKLKPVLVASIQQMDAIKMQPKGAKGAKKQQMAQLKQTTDDQIKNILTPEQYQKMQDMQQQRKDKMKAARQQRMQNQQAPPQNGK
jgi:Spy/CpxP family protein refolding chaperone